MKWKNNFIKAIIFSIVCALFAAYPVAAPAATKNFAEVIPGIQIVPFHISGQYVATTAGVVKFQIPFKAAVLGVSLPRGRQEVPHLR